MTPIKDKLIAENFGFFTTDDYPALMAENFNYQILVRTGRGRFVCKLYELNYKISFIEKSGDYVRDVSLWNN